ncbi:MAG: helix-turn-helix transcriptional regulator [Acidobacteria bacterium]|nr:helix-turn-helix transcriptional regulator [Acidobacteriota bacterium]
MPTMNRKPLQVEPFELQISDQPQTAVQSQRKMALTAEGAFLIDDVLALNGSGNYTFVTCTAWLLELFELQSGDFYFLSGGKAVRPTSCRFGIFYPPFAILESCFDQVKAHWTGMAASAPLPKAFLAAPMIFETAFREPLERLEQVTDILHTSSHRQPITRNPKPSLLSIKTKRLLDENYFIHPAIAHLAARLGVTHAHLTRQFKSDFGFSPSAYAQQLRIADATFRLAGGEAIINVSQEVGYNDLSRFYRQFNKATRQTPGDCQSPKKRKISR